MRQHVKILAVLHLVHGGLGALAAVILTAVFGGLAGLVRIADLGQDGLVGSAVLSLIGAVAILIVLLFSLPSLIAGIGLLNFRPWARVLGIVLAVVELPAIPFHTALGIYGLWVLLSREGTELFERPVAQAA